MPGYATERRIVELREQKRKLIVQVRADNEARVKAGGSWGDEEQGRHKELMKEVHGLNEEIAAQEEILVEERSIESSGRVTDPDALTTFEPSVGSLPSAPAAAPAAEIPEALRALVPENYEIVPRLDRMLGGGRDWVAVAQTVYPFTDVRKDLVASREYNAAFARMIGGGRLTREQEDLLNRGEANAVEMRGDVVSDDDVSGGYLTAPMQAAGVLIKELDDEVFLRRWARKFTLRRARSLGAPKRDARMNSFAWGGEVTPPTKDTALKFGGRELSPHYASGEIDVSRDFLRASVIPPTQIVMSEIARDAGELQEDGFLLGNGSQRPLGVFVASAQGISTARDVATGNAATIMKFEGLKNAKLSIKSGHRRARGFRFLTHRDGILQLTIEKDLNDRYIWEDSLKVGEPDRVIGVPAFDSERVPNTFTTGLYVGMFANWDWYWIVDSLALEILRLNELEARANKVAFVARIKTDGMPVLEEAFARVTLA